MCHAPLEVTVIPMNKIDVLPAVLMRETITLKNYTNKYIITNCDNC